LPARASTFRSDPNDCYWRAADLGNFRSGGANDRGCLIAGLSRAASGAQP